MRNPIKFCKVDLTNSYEFVDYHHLNTPTTEKSIWTISRSQEIACFSRTINSNWVVSRETKVHGWGFHTNLAQLGEGVLPQRKKLILAKFVDGNKTGIWHGYPADYSLMAERVPAEICKKWYESRIISKAQKAKLLQGMDLI